MAGRLVVPTNDSEPGDIAHYVRESLADILPSGWVDAAEANDSRTLQQLRSELDEDSWWEVFTKSGLVVPGWPRSFGGLDLSPGLITLIHSELSKYKLPRSRNPIGINMAGPTVLRWGTDEQKKRLLPPIPAHREIWCQLFSEPGAGSDLASLATMAKPHGGVWVVRGQKVWSSIAHNAHWGLLLARTSPDIPKHEGITCFALDMTMPSVTVRPLYNMTGHDPASRGYYDFNEVFIDEAQIPDEMRLGPVNEGWQVAAGILSRERSALGGTSASLPGAVAGRTLDQLIRRHGPITNADSRDRVTTAWVHERLISMTSRRSAARQAKGEPPGPEASIGKLAQSQFAQRLQALAVDLEGVRGTGWTDDDWIEGTVWSFLNSRARTIAGGTSEVNRNVLAERTLGLPSEPRSDRGKPWSAIPHGGAIPDVDVE